MLTDEVSPLRVATLIESLCLWARERPRDVVFTFLGDGETESSELTFQELDQQARSIAAGLSDSSSVSGERVVLLLPPGLDFVVAFFGCLYGGAIAVPAHPPRLRRTDQRIRSILGDCRPAAILSTQAILGQREFMTETQPELAEIPWMSVESMSAESMSAESLSKAPVHEWRPPDLDAETPALLQYTSGSTSLPKGVVVTHGNLLHNERMIADAFDQSRQSVVVGWLPPHHDMGLIGNILQPLYTGAHSILMPPMAFLQRPIRWLRAISRYRATTSGGPNFAYELAVRKITDDDCADLDLTSWRIAFNGAEPVRYDTLDRFARRFRRYGFTAEALYPCYGLAEATLLVSGGGAFRGAASLALSGPALDRNEVEVVAGPEGGGGSPRTGGMRRLVSCGRPWCDQWIVIVDPETRELCPEHRVGEIWVAGESIAKGYWGRPAESQRTFQARLARPPAGKPGGPYLRTGDLGFLHEGELFVTGRLKDLILIRGRNLYPQDVEATAQAAHDGLVPDAGAAFSIEDDGEERLVVVHEIHRRAAGLAGEIVDAVRVAVAEEHEARLHDVVLVGERTIPKTSSGKIRRSACRDAYLAGELRRVAFNGTRSDGGGASATRVDERASTDPGREQIAALAGAERVAAVRVWLRREAARSLGTASFGADRPLAALGLDSLGAVELKHAVETDLGVDVSVAELLAGVTLDQLTARIAESLGAAGEHQPEASGGDAGRQQAIIPLSQGQRALLFLERLAPQSGVYNIATAAFLTGDIETAAFRRAVDEIAARHPLLGAVVVTGNGEPRQRLAARLPDFSVVDAVGRTVSQLREELRDRALAPFDLERGPLLRAGLWRISSQEHVLLLAVHHLVADFWSLALVFDELGKLYEQEKTGGCARLPAPRSHYADFVDRQQRWLESPQGQAARSYWHRQLAGRPVALDLNTDRPRPAVQTYSGESVTVAVSAGVTSLLHQCAHERGATLFAALLAAFGALLHRASGQPEVRIGVPTAGRGAARWAGVVGYFVNPVVFRPRFAGNPSFAATVDELSAAAVEALEHQDYPFALLADELQRERDPSRPPLFQAMLLLQRAPGKGPRELSAFALGEDGHGLSWGDLAVQSLKLPRRPVPFELSLSLAELISGELAVSFQYNTDLFDRTTASRLVRALRNLLAGAVAAPGEPVARLAFLASAEHQQLLVEWNDTGARPPRESDLTAAFVGTAQEIPDRVAVVSGETYRSYRELDRRARRLARRLASAGAGPGSVVGLCLERSPELLAGLWAVLEAGAAYLPLDPAYPEARLRAVVDDAAASVLLGDRRGVGLLRRLAAGRPIRIVEVGFERKSPAVEGVAGPASRPIGDLAYLIYTSGSTGEPKGVQIPHAAALRFFAGMDRNLHVSGAGKWLAVTSISFDISVLELLWTTTRGFTVVLRPEPPRVKAAATGARTLVETGAPPRTTQWPEKAIGFSLMYFSSDVEVAPQERYRLVMEGARFADRAGFEAVWTPERHFHAFGGLFPNPSVTSAAIAAVTERIAIRAGSVVLPLHHPVRVAEEWSVVDNLSQGRVGVSVASGWQVNDFVLAPDRFAARKEVMARDLDVLRRLWRGEEVRLENGAGEEVPVRILPPPVQKELPVWVTAAGSADTFRLAGELGVGVLTHLLGQGVDELAEKIGVYREARSDAGHTGDGHVTLMLHTFVGEEPEPIRDLVREPFTRYLRTSFGLMKSLAPGEDFASMTEEDLRNLLARAFDRYYETSGLFGTPQSCLALVDRLKSIGVDELACLVDFGVATDAVLASLRSLARLRAASNAGPAAVTASAEPSDMPVDSVPAELLRRGVTHLQCTPSFARALLADPDADAGLATLRQMLVGGEALTAGLADDLGRRLQGELLNVYGPTETTVWSSAARLRRGAAVTLGRPLATTRMAVVDRLLENVGLGISGELVIGGEAVARGYHARPGLTAQRFVPDPFSGAARGSRMYRTGDLARYSTAGTVEFLGRFDHQVKVRGHRIELGEVESLLRLQPAVREAVVAARESAAGERQLVAYLVPEGNGHGRLREPPAERWARLMADRSSYRLPNGLTVAHLSSPQTQAIYREIFADNVYLRHGIELGGGACVFDVGANIGLFTLFVNHHFEGARVYAFEPIPPTFAVLRTNVELFDLDTQVFQFGLSDREEVASLTFYPQMAGLSGRFARGDRDTTRSILRTWMEHVGAPRDGAGGRDIDDLVEEYLKSETYECELKTLSSVMRQQGVETVDLLKVDVEGSEIHVLRGIDEADWPKIRQIVLEVHSKELLEASTEILESRGYRLEVEELVPIEDRVDYVYMVYARRSGAAARPAARPPGAGLSTDAVRRALAEKLPAYMVPDVFVVLERLPLTPNGKVDRRSLPAPEDSSGRRRAPFEPPGNGLQKTIAEVWAATLRLDRVGLHENFFESGGNSLLLMQAHGRLREALGTEVSLVELMRYPTVGSLSRHLESRDASGTGNGARSQRTEERTSRQRRAFGRRKKQSQREERAI